MTRNRQDRGRFDGVFNKCDQFLDMEIADLDRIASIMVTRLPNVQGAVEGTEAVPEDFSTTMYKIDMLEEIRDKFAEIWDHFGYKMDILKCIETQRAACRQIKSNLNLDKDSLGVIVWFESVLKTIEEMWS